MPRVGRIAPGGFIYHVLNRGVGKMTLFRSRKDFQAFQRCLVETQKQTPMRVLGFCVMSNHWHLLLWPQRDGELARFMMRLTIRHVRRWLEHRRQVGTGHVYQGRYKSFVIQDDRHLATVCRYVERNPVRAGMARSCRDWPWSSVGQDRLPAELRVSLSEFAGLRGNGWIEWVDRPQTAEEEQAVQDCIKKDRPFGSEKWLETMRRTLGWREPLRRGRPRKKRR
ncbi:MAG: transposase [Tepidisphaeraceae bacterium]